MLALLCNRRLVLPLPLSRGQLVAQRLQGVLRVGGGLRRGVDSAAVIGGPQNRLRPGAPVPHLQDLRGETLRALAHAHGEHVPAQACFLHAGLLLARCLFGQQAAPLGLDCAVLSVARCGLGLVEATSPSLKSLTEGMCPRLLRDELILHAGSKPPLASQLILDLPSLQPLLLDGRLFIDPLLQQSKDTVLLVSNKLFVLV